MDSDDVLVKALEPGERIAWSDRPHRLWGCVRRVVAARLTTRASKVIAGVLVGFVAVAAVLSGRFALGGGVRAATNVALLYQIVLAVACIPLAFEAVLFLHRIARSLDDRYAATDRGRAIVVADGTILFFALPPPEAITTRAPGDVEHGDVELGEVTVHELSRHGPRSRRRVTFHDVSYPLIAVESLRAIARDAARRAASGAPPEGSPGGATGARLLD